MGVHLLGCRCRLFGIGRCPLDHFVHFTDSLVHLIHTRYALEFPYEAMCGCTLETDRSLITDGRMNELYSLILEKYKALEKQCDFVLCCGTDYTGVSAALEFDVNVDVATNLGCLMLPVIKGSGRRPDQLVASVQAVIKSLHEKKCEIIAAIVNRVVPDHAAGVEKAAKTLPCSRRISIGPRSGRVGSAAIAAASRSKPQKR